MKCYLGLFSLKQLKSRRLTHAVAEGYIALGVDEIIGYVVDGSTPVKVKFVAKTPPPLGEYVVVEASGKRYLALVERSVTRSITLSTAVDIYDPVVVERLSRKMGEDDVFYECIARVLQSLEGSETAPTTPPLPGSPVKRAPSALLAKLFGAEMRDGVRIGRLSSRPEIPVYVSANKLVTRHLAILAITGAGKSNTVAVLLDRLTSSFKATSLVFDFHGEYVSTKFTGRQHLIEPIINPRNMSVSEFMVLLGVESRFYNQERIVRKAFQAAKNDTSLSPFLQLVRENVESLRGREDAKSLAAVLNKIDALSEKHRDILDDNVADVLDRIEIGAINIVDLSRLDEEAADVVVSHFLRKILASRKKYKKTGEGLTVPIVIVIEEAHVLIPRDRETISKYWVSRIAREGRKFGVGLVIVSQRPKGLDPDTLSQMNNKIILRIVEPSDQKYIRESSETLSEELIEQLPGLSIGEAVVIGPFIRLPARIRIDKFSGELGGADPDVVSEWLSRGSREEEVIDTNQLFMEIERYRVVE